MGQNLLTFLSIGVLFDRDACPPSQTMSPYCCIFHQAVIRGDRESWREKHRTVSNDIEIKEEMWERDWKKNTKFGLEVKKEGEGPRTDTNWFTKTMTFMIFSSSVNIKVQWREARGKASHHLSSSLQSGRLSQLVLETLHRMAQPVLWSAPPLVFDSCPRLLFIAHAMPSSEASFRLLSTSLNSIYPSAYMLQGSPFVKLPLPLPIKCDVIILWITSDLFRPCFQHLAFYILFAPKMFTEHSLCVTHCFRCC